MAGWTYLKFWTLSQAIDQSFRPLGCTPAFGRAGAPFGAAIFVTRERLPFRLSY
jgi:hypothetical protein